MASSAPAICMARTVAPMSSNSSCNPCGASLTATGRTPSRITVSRASPARLAPCEIRAAPMSARTTAQSPLSRWASSTRCWAARPNGTARSRPLMVPFAVRLTGWPARVVQDIAPRGEEMRTRASNHPASRVSATGNATAKRPVSRTMAKPSARSAPAPPSSSGTQASVSPASSSAAHAGPFQLSSVARLTVCGSHRSRKIRRRGLGDQAVACHMTSPEPFFYPGVMRPTTAAVISVDSVPETIVLAPRLAISARRAGTMAAMPPIMMPRLPKLAKPQSA